MKTRYLSALLFAVLIVAPAAAQSGGSPSTTEEPEVLILAPKSTSTVPLLLVEAMDREQNSVSGASVRVELFSNHPQALARLLRGDAVALLTGTSQGWSNHLDGGPVVMVNTGVWGVSSMITREADLDTPADLQGLKVAMPFPGAPLDVQMRYIWSSLGIDPESDVEISFSPPTQTVGLLLTGKIDAAPLPEPLATNLVMNKGLHRAFEIPDAWAEVSGGVEISPQVSLFSTESLVSADIGLFTSIMNTWRSASEAVSDGPAVYAERFAGDLGLPVPVVAEALARTILFVPTQEENAASVESYFEIVRSVYPEDRPGLDDSFFVELQ